MTPDHCRLVVKPTPLRFSTASPPSLLPSTPQNLHRPCPPDTSQGTAQRALPAASQTFRVPAPGIYPDSPAHSRAHSLPAKPTPSLLLTLGPLPLRCMSVTPHFTRASLGVGMLGVGLVKGWWVMKGWGTLARGAVLTAAGRWGFHLPSLTLVLCLSFLPPLTCFSLPPPYICEVESIWGLRFGLFGWELRGAS